MLPTILIEGLNISIRLSASLQSSDYILARRKVGFLRIVSEDPISGFLLIVRTNKLLLLLVLLDTRSFQHIARFIDSNGHLD